MKYTIDDEERYVLMKFKGHMERQIYIECSHLALNIMKSIERGNHIMCDCMLRSVNEGLSMYNSTVKPEVTNESN